MASKPVILLVDDDPALHALVSSVLERHDFETIIASDGPDGIEKAKSLNPDAILLDIKMSGMSGYDVLKTLRKKRETADIPVVMLTGDNAVKDVSKSLELGANDYIVKPFNPENLILRIKNVLP